LDWFFDAFKHQQEVEQANEEAMKLSEQEEVEEQEQQREEW
jgi:hypothetical protein